MGYIIDNCNLQLWLNIDCKISALWVISWISDLWGVADDVADKESQSVQKVSSHEKYSKHITVVRVSVVL